MSKCELAMSRRYRVLSCWTEPCGKSINQAYKTGKAEENYNMPVMMDLTLILLGNTVTGLLEVRLTGSFLVIVDELYV